MPPLYLRKGVFFVQKMGSTTMRALHLSADDLNRIARALQRVGLIEITEEITSSGRRRVFLEAV